MASFVSKSGVLDLSVGDSPSRAGTPILEMLNLVPGNVVKLTANFFARTNERGRANGFYYQLAAINADEVTALSPDCGVFQSSSGWQSCTLIALFRLNAVYQSPTEDVDFEILFSKGDLSGEAQIRDLLLLGEVTSQSPD